MKHFRKTSRVLSWGPYCFYCTQLTSLVLLPDMVCAAIYLLMTAEPMGHAHLSSWLDFRTSCLSVLATLVTGWQPMIYNWTRTKRNSCGAFCRLWKLSNSILCHARPRRVSRQWSDDVHSHHQDCGRVFRHSAPVMQYTSVIVTWCFYSSSII